MRYKIGDRVRVRKDLVVGKVYGGALFDKKRCSWLGKIVEISKVYTGYYRIRDCFLFVWTDDMLEPITDLTTSEVVAFGQVMCDSEEFCSNNCPVMKIRSKYSYCSCPEVKLEHTDEYIETVTKWVAGSDYTYISGFDVQFPMVKVISSTVWSIEDLKKLEVVEAY